MATRKETESESLVPEFLIISVWYNGPFKIHRAFSGQNRGIFDL